MEDFKKFGVETLKSAAIIEKELLGEKASTDESPSLVEELEEVFSNDLPCVIKGHGVLHSIHGEGQPATVRGYPPCENRYSANICQKFYESLARAKPVIPCQCGSSHFFEEFRFVQI